MIRKTRQLTFYYDTFDYKIVLTKDKNSPPERYFIIYAGIDDIYKDTFVRGEDKLSYAYSSFDEWNKYAGYFLEQNNFTDSRLYSRQYPKKKFAELLKDYGFKIINDDKIIMEADEIPVSKEIDALDFIIDRPRYSTDIKYRDSVDLIRQKLIEISEEDDEDE